MVKKKIHNDIKILTAKKILMTKQNKNSDWERANTQSSLYLIIFF